MYVYARSPVRGSHVCYNKWGMFGTAHGYVFAGWGLCDMALAQHLLTANIGSR